MDPLLAELQTQYRATLGMYRTVLEACPEEVWIKTYAGIPFWREAYHTIFWLHTFLGPRDKRFHPHPFGRDIDPQLFTPPNNTCGREEALAYAAQTVAYVDETFPALTLDELAAPDQTDEGEYRTFFHRLMYGLRHGQHHIGRLTSFLDLEGVEIESWQG